MRSTILVLVCLYQPLIAYAQSNQDILDKLSDMEFDREVRAIERNLNKQQRQLAPTLPPVVDVESAEQKQKNAQYWNLTYQEYVRRDSMGTLRCNKKYQSGTEAWANCWYATILDVPQSEVEIRNSKAKSSCMKLSSEKKTACIREIIVLNKKSWWGF